MNFLAQCELGFIRKIRIDLDLQEQVGFAELVGVHGKGKKYNISKSIEAEIITVWESGQGTS